MSEQAEMSEMAEQPDADDRESMFPAHVQAQRGHRRKTHRGRRKKSGGTPPATDHHAQAHTHLGNAKNASSPKASMTHLWKAVASFRKADQAHHTSG